MYEGEGVSYESYFSLSMMGIPGIELKLSDLAAHLHPMSHSSVPFLKRQSWLADISSQRQAYLKLLDQFAE